jgi:hypothetical protein
MEWKWGDFSFPFREKLLYSLGGVARGFCNTVWVTTASYHFSNENEWGDFIRHDVYGKYGVLNKEKYNIRGIRNTGLSPQFYAYTNDDISAANAICSDRL